MGAAYRRRDADQFDHIDAIFRTFNYFLKIAITIRFREYLQRV